MNKRIFLVFTFLIIYITTTNAQLFKRATDARRPKAILVELRAEKRKIDYYSHTYPAMSAGIRSDAAKVAEATINDFKDHFSFCPVYFFIDTNAQYILDKKFDGVLLNADGSIATNIVITPRDTNYFIVYYGHALSEPKAEQQDNTKQQDATFLLGKGLVVNNYKLQQIGTTPYHYVYRSPLWFLFTSKQNKDPKYMYVSKKYNLEYYPTAATFDKDLTEYFEGNRR